LLREYQLLYYPTAVVKTAPTKKAPSVQIRMVKAALLRKDLSIGEFAEQAGLNRRTLGNLMCGNGHSSRLKARVEDALGLAIWSTPAELRARRDSGAGPKFGGALGGVETKKGIE
jgi:hypothetical protein